MPVILNLKRCDNVKECSVPSACPTQALYWDEAASSLAADVTKCIDCGACKGLCPSGAVTVIEDPEEHKAALEIIENDPSTVADLFVDRYGAMTVSGTNEAKVAELEKIVKNASSTTIIEILDADNPSCLISAIPYKVLLGEKNVIFYKVMVSGDELKKAQGIVGVTADTALIVVKNGKIFARFEGQAKEGTPHALELQDFIDKNV